MTSQTVTQKPVTNPARPAVVLLMSVLAVWFVVAVAVTVWGATGSFAEADAVLALGVVNTVSTIWLAGVLRNVLKS